MDHATCRGYLANFTTASLPTINAGTYEVRRVRDRQKALCAVRERTTQITICVYRVGGARSCPTNPLLLLLGER